MDDEGLRASIGKDNHRYAREHLMASQVSKRLNTHFFESNEVSVE